MLNYRRGMSRTLWSFVNRKLPSLDFSGIRCVSHPRWIRSINWAVNFIIFRTTFFFFFKSHDIPIVVDLIRLLHTYHIYICIYIYTYTHNDIIPIRWRQIQSLVQSNWRFFVLFFIMNKSQSPSHMFQNPEDIIVK